MRPDALSPLNPDQLCNECSQVSHSTYKCEDCEKRSHVLCMLRDGTWNISALFQKRNEVYCEEHVKEEYCFCGKEYVDGQQYMICCDLCDIWYHGDCIGITQQVGETIDDFVCKFCDQWNSSVKKILKEDEKEKKAHVKIPKQLVNFKLKD